MFSLCLAVHDFALNLLVRQALRASSSTQQGLVTGICCGNWTVWHSQAVAICGMLAVNLFVPCIARGQLYDGLDAYPPRWHLQTSDCDARVISQNHLVDGGLDGRACETVTFVAGHGTEAILVYPIEPIRPLDELTANVSVMSVKDGCRIGFRIRFPYHRDATHRHGITTYIFGTTYDRPGAYAPIGVGAIERELRMKTIALRREHGRDVDLRDPYVDAVALNVYCGPGKSSLRIDELHVDGMIEAGSLTANQPTAALKPDSTTPGSPRPSTSSPALPIASRAFPVGQITTILQHNGEPLGWVRSLGFDAVLLASPPNADILREAVRARVAVYAPPPSAPDPALQTLLEPVAGWYIGSGLALDAGRIDAMASASDRLRKWPTIWQRPIIAAPLESRRLYEPLVDAIIHDLTPPNRSLNSDEEVATLVQHRAGIPSRLEFAVGISSMPTESLLAQADAIADRVGAPRCDHFQWHAMWLQAIRSLEQTPSAILFRSTRPLSSGDSLSSNRSLAVSYINRMIAMIEPWVAGATSVSAVPVAGAPYHVGQLSIEGTDVFLLSTSATRGSQVLAGDGAFVELHLPPGEASKTVWRLTNFSAERVPLQTTEQGSVIQLISPDAVELLFASSDPTVGTHLTASAARFSRQAGLDRWQLAEEAVRRTANDWRLANSARILAPTVQSNLANIASSTLADAGPLFRAGDIDASLRMARRADAWALRSDWQLTEALMPDWPHPTSCPPATVGNLPVQVAWLPLMKDSGWGKNRLPAGTLDDVATLSGANWNFGRRLQGRATSDVSLVERDAISGAALRATVTPLVDEQLPGGYEGTVIQITSPSVRIPAGKAIRIDAMVRTIGFGGPHQGLLVYDSIGGQESGLLVRGQSGWTPVRLYRQSLAETEVQVMFELIGAGEATIDEVQLKMWEPTYNSVPTPRPLTSGESP